MRNRHATPLPSLPSPSTLWKWRATPPPLLHSAPRPSSPLHYSTQRFRNIQMQPLAFSDWMLDRQRIVTGTLLLMLPLIENLLQIKNF